MKQKLLAITQTFTSPSEIVRKPAIQQKIEHYLKSQLKDYPKPT